MISKFMSYFSYGSSNEAKNEFKLIGELFLKEIGKPIERLCDESTISLSIIDEAKQDYALNVFNEDYKQEDDDGWQRMQFKISSSSRFMKFDNSEGQRCIMWERSFSFFYLVLFVDDLNTKNYDGFIKMLSEMIVSKDFGINLASAAKEDTKKDVIFNYDQIEDVDKFIDENFKKLKEEKELELLANKVNNIKLEKDKFSFLFPKSQETFKSNPGIFERYNTEKDDMEKISHQAVFKIYHVDVFVNYIVIEDIDESVLAYTKITSSNSTIFNIEDKNIMFLADNGVEQKFEAYTFIFTSNEISQVKKLIKKLEYEQGASAPFEDLDESTRKFIEDVNDDDSSQNEMSNLPQLEVDFSQKYKEYDDDSSSSNKNKITTQAFIKDRTFVIKEDNTIGVYKSNSEEGDQLSHLMNLPAVAEYNGKEIDLSSAQMFKSDANLLFLDKNNKNTIWQYDVPTGKIVTEWACENMNDIVAIAPQNKFDQMTDNQVIVGINPKNIFTLDGRLNKKDKIVDKKTYKTKPKFSCLSTTLNGGVAAGTLEGDIRLYSEIGKNAKTLLRCFGDPIRAIDVTKDGSYILATCDKYLIVICTEGQEGNGFTTSLKKSKRTPKTLKLNPVDIAKYGLGNDCFTPAKFNVSKDYGESIITTSIGEYIVMWGFDKVKKGILDQYKIKKVGQLIIGSLGKYNKDEVVVTMPNKIRIQTQKQY